MLLQLVASSEILEQAYTWCCKARENYPDCADIWILRERWDKVKLIIQQQILTRQLPLFSANTLPLRLCYHELLQEPCMLPPVNEPVNFLRPRGEKLMLFMVQSVTGKFLPHILFK